MDYKLAVQIFSVLIVHCFPRNDPLIIEAQAGGDASFWGATLGPQYALLIR
jgi:hypothetical protein